jgi:hypothetical protein
MQKIIDTGEKYPDLLKKFRVTTGLTMQKFAESIEESLQDVQNNELRKRHLINIQFFKKICIEYNINPMELLGLKYVEVKGSPLKSCGIVGYKIYPLKNKIIWKCPLCLYENITYMDLGYDLTSKVLFHLIVSHSYYCENETCCNSFKIECKNIQDCLNHRG